MWSSLSWSRREIWSAVGCIEEWGKKKPEKPCKLFDTNRCIRCKKIYWEREWTVANFWGNLLYPTTPSLYVVGFTSIAINLLEGKFKIEHMLQGYFLCHFGVNAVEAHFIFECPLYNPITCKFSSLFENVVPKNFKSFFQLDQQANINFYLTETSTLRHSKEITNLKPSCDTCFKKKNWTTCSKHDNHYGLNMQHHCGHLVWPFNEHKNLHFDSA